MCNYAQSLRLLQALVVAVHNLFHRRILLAQSVPDGLQLLIPPPQKHAPQPTSFSDERRRKFIPTLQRALPPINHDAKSAIRPDQQVKQVPVY
jgi:hypothetical protein